MKHVPITADEVSGVDQEHHIWKFAEPDQVTSSGRSNCVIHTHDKPTKMINEMRSISQEMLLLLNQEMSYLIPKDQYNIEKAANYRLVTYLVHTLQIDPIMLEAAYISILRAEQYYSPSFDGMCKRFHGL